VSASSETEAESKANANGLLVATIRPAKSWVAVPRPLWPTIVMLVIVFAIGYFAGREHLKYEIRSSIRSAFSGLTDDAQDVTERQSARRTEPPERVEPGFDISLKRFGNYEIPSRSYVITNTSESPLTVYKVVYNGEFEAKRGEHDGVWVNNSQEGFPVTLTIGDRAYVVRTLPGHFGVERADYTKDVVFLEVHTDRGVFKFTSSGRMMD